MPKRSKRRQSRPPRPLFPRPPVSATEIGSTTTDSGAPVPGVDETDRLLSAVPWVDTNDRQHLDPPLACPAGGCDYLAGTPASKPTITGPADPGAGVADAGERPKDLGGEPDLIGYGEEIPIERIVRLPKPTAEAD